MAANLQGKRAIGLGKRLADQIRAAGAAPRVLAALPPPPVSAAARRGVHASAYDKNQDEQVRPSAVPDDVIQLQSDKYWAPHPTTGVFGPADRNAHHPDPAAAYPRNNGGSALDQAAWFRPLEDVDKAPHA